MKAVTIVGRGESWKECPFHTEEIWGAATCLITPKLADHPYTKVFAFDNDDNIKLAVAEAHRRNIPIVSVWGYATEPWPTRGIVRTTRSAHFLDTISRMLGYAIYYEYSKLFIYGIDYGPQWRNLQSKSIVTFWIGFAMGRGIEVCLGRGSMRWAYNHGPEPDEPAVEIPLKDRISEALVCESVSSCPTTITANTLSELSQV